MNANDHLKLAQRILSDRAASRDAPNGERSMAKTVQIFEAWTGIALSESDGWRFMVALKMSRESAGKHHDDDYTDLAGYAGLLGECAHSEYFKNLPTGRNRPATSADLDS